jgi:hypothetical protein
MIARAKAAKSTRAEAALRDLICCFESCGGTVIDLSGAKVSDGSFDRKFFLDCDLMGLGQMDSFLANIGILAPKEFLPGYCTLFGSLRIIISILHFRPQQLNASVFNQFDMATQNLAQSLLQLFDFDPQRSVKGRKGLYLPMLLQGRIKKQMESLFSTYGASLVQVCSPSGCLLCLALFLLALSLLFACALFALHVLCACSLRSVRS